MMKRDFLEAFGGGYSENNDDDSNYSFDSSKPERFQNMTIPVRDEEAQVIDYDALLAEVDNDDDYTMMEAPKQVLTETLPAAPHQTELHCIVHSGSEQGHSVFKKMFIFIGNENITEEVD